MFINLLAKVASHFGIQPGEAERFLKFAVVGTIGFVVDFGTLTMLVELAHLPTLVANVAPFTERAGFIAANTISFTAAVLSNFGFNRYWVFPESRPRRRSLQLLQFAAVSVIGLVLNNTVFILLKNPFDQLLGQIIWFPEAIEGYMPAKMIATILILFWNYFINRYWTYRDVNS